MSVIVKHAGLEQGRVDMGLCPVTRDLHGGFIRNTAH